LRKVAESGVTSLEVLHGVNIFFPQVDGQQAYGNKLMNNLGVAFRLWCRSKKIEKPPAVWDLHLIGRGENDSKNTFPILDSNVKAAHTKPILFFLSELARELASHCPCFLL